MSLRELLWYVFEVDKSYNKISLRSLSDLQIIVIMVSEALENTI